MRGTIDPLHRVTEGRNSRTVADCDALEIFEQRRTRIPTHPLAGFDEVVAILGDERDDNDARKTQMLGEVAKILFDLLKDFGRITDQIHLVDGDDDMPNAEDRHDDAVPLRLRQDAFARIDEQHGEVRSRGACRHIAGILFMAGRIGDNELALRGGEIAISDVDCDPLLAFGRKPIDQQCEIEVVALRCRASWKSFSRVASKSSCVSPASYSRRPINVDLPSSTDPQVMKRNNGFSIGKPPDGACVGAGSARLPCI